ncbi:hypothetical protein ACGF7U_26950 [Micromonospora sp. NPDC047670]|uniref:hypothetical protein n=1 Tax=Micromonospora sp. NPDC047670 TaxID=3364252 RepID=UPI0037218F0A
MEVYYSGGYSCARTVSSANTWGVSKVMSVELWVCSSGTSNYRLLAADDRDHGTYRYYADPVTAYASGRCIWVIGNIYYPPTGSDAGNNRAGWCGFPVRRDGPSWRPAGERGRRAARPGAPAAPGSTFRPGASPHLGPRIDTAPRIVNHLSP